MKRVLNAQTQSRTRHSRTYSSISSANGTGAFVRKCLTQNRGFRAYLAYLASATPAHGARGQVVASTPALPHCKDASVSFTPSRSFRSPASTQAGDNLTTDVAMPRSCSTNIAMIYSVLNLLMPLSVSGGTVSHLECATKSVSGHLSNPYPTPGVWQFFSLIKMRGARRS